ncbi:HNH endonuclease [Bacillus cereus group sp. BC251]|jgi:5-methylcytosine-specific restriction protein A|uniref:HNH endonuclease n=1 Tax=Bacillus cereus group TaxID=86661 RepID=UPI000C339847|nr:HNH endonuclease [Bacillus sp. HBCD-sjtu]HDR4389389.1 HNH endonuclease [Bacillus cereus]AUD24488.1 restriction endonuclease [Bacillus sp. HBCD-sjtu]HDR4393960.1 HNH endonuclease [Bacillus cereus]HDR4598022.1 HNH endonuclease [Bacillus cereus]HDR4600911.1 HNH endonuclease [Bacillus cereus]
MTKYLHLFFKFKGEVKTSGRIINTIREHKIVFEEKNRLIWGQFSNGTGRVSDRNRERITNQVNNGIDSFAFFLMNNGGERELFVGKINRLYDKQEITPINPLKEFIPAYYSGTVGTSAEKISVFVDMSTFLKIDSKLVNEITVESTGEKVLNVNNSRSIFLTNISVNLQESILEILRNYEINYQYQVEQENIDEVIMEDYPKDLPSIFLGAGRGAYKRDPKIAKKAIVLANYKCEIDLKHEDFISKVTKKTYVEAHHLIPMGFQGDFQKSIDVEANIISLCANCHKKLHHAEYEVIEPLIEKLYDARINRLNNCGINIEKRELINYYKR